jgi:hypothetical protein
MRGIVRLYIKGLWAVNATATVMIVLGPFQIEILKVNRIDG